MATDKANISGEKQFWSDAVLAQQARPGSMFDPAPIHITKSMYLKHQQQTEPSKIRQNHTENMRDKPNLIKNIQARKGKA